MTWAKSSYSSYNGNCLEWRKSSFNTSSGHCVEVAPQHVVTQVRDSKLADSPILTFTATAWRTFITKIKAS